MTEQELLAIESSARHHNADIEDFSGFCLSLIAEIRRLQHPVADAELRERCAKAIAIATWGGRGGGFLAPEYATHAGGQNTVREQCFRQADAVLREAGFEIESKSK